MVVQAIPFVIQEYTIVGSGTGDGIEIQNTDLYLIIENCNVTNFLNSIYVIGCINVEVIDNNVTSATNGYGIYFSNSNNSIANSNAVFGGFNVNAIEFAYSNNCTITQNHIWNLTNSGTGIGVYGGSGQSTLSNAYVASNNLQNISVVGITFSNEQNATITNNLINSVWVGISSFGYGDGTCINNVLNNCSICGIAMQADKPYTLNNNTLENCSIGFELDSDNLTVFNSTIFNCSIGIYNYNSNDNSIITDNNITGSSNNSIIFDSITNVTITNNNIFNSQNASVSLINTTACIVSQNYIDGYGNEGIYTQQGQSNQILSNVVFNGSKGIIFNGSLTPNVCVNNTLFNNTVANAYSENNSVDDWNSNNYGNFWGDYQTRYPVCNARNILLEYSLFDQREQFGRCLSMGE